MPELPSSISLEVVGAVTVNASADRWVADFNGAVDSAVANCGVAPTGASLIVDILKNGVSVYTDPTQRPVIAAGATRSQVPAGLMGAPQPVGIQQTIGATSQNNEIGTNPAPKLQGYVSFVPGDIFVLSVVQVGATVAGSNLQVSVEYNAA